MSRRKRLGRQLTDDQEEFLAHGDILTGVALAETFGTLEAAHAAWAIHREELMASCEPGGRPLAWWLFEAPEWRHLADSPTPLTELGPVGYFQASPLSQAKILERLGLLSKDEQAALRQQRESRRQPETVDPADNVVPFTTRLVFPPHDSNGNGRPA